MTRLSGQPFAIQIQGLPPSWNDAHFRGMRSQPKPHTRHFRKKVENAFEAAATWRGRVWDPKGVVAVHVMFCSPSWVKDKAKVKDVDNLIKTTLDAVQSATKVPDHLNWEVHVYKIPRAVECTLIYLVDLGKTVDYYE